MPMPCGPTQAARGIRPRRTVAEQRNELRSFRLRHGIQNLPIAHGNDDFAGLQNRNAEVWPSIPSKNGLYSQRRPTLNVRWGVA